MKSTDIRNTTVGTNMEVIKNDPGVRINSANPPPDVDKLSEFSQLARPCN
jgi:hypothetical protein